MICKIGNCLAANSRHAAFIEQEGAEDAELGCTTGPAIPDRAKCVPIRGQNRSYRG